MGFKAILPKKYTSGKVGIAQMDAVLKAFGIEAQNRLQKYPQWTPWKNPPKTGLHAGGKRTGTYGRGWGAYKIVSGQSVTLENSTPYSVWVGGPKSKRPGQAQALARRGWPSVTDVGKAAATKAVQAAKGFTRP